VIDPVVLLPEAGLVRVVAMDCQAGSPVRRAICHRAPGKKPLIQLLAVLVVQAPPVLFSGTSVLDSVVLVAASLLMA